MRLQLEVLDCSWTPYVARAVAECSRLIYERIAEEAEADQLEFGRVGPAT